MSSHKNPIVHFEMPFVDQARLSKFYEDAFGWKMMAMGPEMNNYVLAGTAPTDENNMVTRAGAINGGFAPKSESFDKPSLVVGVEDIKATIANVKAAGGDVLGEPVMIPGVGLYVNFTDSEGNKLAALQYSV